MKAFILVAVVFAVVSFYLLKDSQINKVQASRGTISEHNNAAEYTMPEDKLEAVNYGSTQQENSNIASPEDGVDHPLPEDDSVAGVQNNALSKESELLIHGQVIRDETSINNAFLNEDGSVYRDAMNDVFLPDKFSNVIELMKDMDETEASVERERKFIEKLNQLSNGHTYDEEYACRGKICAVTFKHRQDFELDVNELDNFDRNYTFENEVTDEYGDTVVKVIYIQTDDPSELTLSLN